MDLGDIKVNLVTELNGRSMIPLFNGKRWSECIDKDVTIFPHWRRIIGLADRPYLDITGVDWFLAS
jgi:hypothetical protein